MDPLSLNRLTYARNNPTSFTDPSGLCLEDACVLEGAAAYWVLSGGAVVSFAALAVTAQQVSRVLSDAYVQERLQEWASSRFAVVTTFADEASGFSRASASASGRQSHGTAYAKRTYGKWVDGLSRIRPKAGRPRWALPPGQRGFVEWDPSHGGELELYDGRGNHLGVLDPNTGERIKGPVPGRTSPP